MYVQSFFLGWWRWGSIIICDCAMEACIVIDFYSSLVEMICQCSLTESHTGMRQFKKMNSKSPLFLRDSVFPISSQPGYRCIPILWWMGVSQFSGGWVDPNSLVDGCIPILWWMGGSQFSDGWVYPNSLVDGCIPILWWMGVSQFSGGWVYPNSLVDGCIPILWWMGVSQFSGGWLYPNSLVDGCIPILWWMGVS